MSEQTATSLREADNTVIIEGYLKEKKLERIVSDGKNCIRGELIVSDGDKAEYRVKYFTYEKTKDGKDISAYKGLETVMSEHLSIAEATNRGLEKTDATRVRFTGASLDSYVNNGKLYTGIKGAYPPKMVVDNFTPRAEFKVEVYFNSIRPEFKDDVETGRVLIEGIVPIYGGKVCVLNFVAEGNSGQYILNNYVVGKTALIEGKIVNSSERIVTTTEGFNGTMENVTTKYLSELVVINGSPEQYDEEDSRSYNTEVIKKAMAERQIKIEADSKKNAETASANTANVGFNLPQNGVGRTLNF